MTKTYESKRHPSLFLGRFEKEDGKKSGVGFTNGRYATDDAGIQGHIEGLHQFKVGEIVLVPDSVLAEEKKANEAAIAAVAKDREEKEKAAKDAALKRKSSEESAAASEKARQDEEKEKRRLHDRHVSGVTAREVKARKEAEAAAAKAKAEQPAVVVAK